MKVSNVSAAAREKDTQQHLAFSIVGREIGRFGIQTFAEVVEDEEHALVMVQQLRPRGGAGLAALLEDCRQVGDPGVLDGFGRRLTSRRWCGSPIHPEFVVDEIEDVTLRLIVDDPQHREDVQECGIDIAGVAGEVCLSPKGPVLVRKIARLLITVWKAVSSSFNVT